MNPRRLESQSRALPTELHPPLFHYFASWQLYNMPYLIGAPGRIRTCDPRLRRPMLYPAELQAQDLYLPGRITPGVLPSALRAALCAFKFAPGNFVEPATLGLAYQLRLSTPHYIAGLWSGLSLHHLRCRTYSLYGSPMRPVAQVSSGLPSAWSYSSC